MLTSARAIMVSMQYAMNTASLEFMKLRMALKT